MDLLNNPFATAFCNELRKSFYIICHLTSNLLPYYLVKFESSTVQAYRIVIKLKVCKVVCFQ